MKCEVRSSSNSRPHMQDSRRLRVLFVPEWYPTMDSESQVAGTFCREHVRAASLYDKVAVVALSGRQDRVPTLQWKSVNDGGIPTFYARYGLSPIPKTTLPFFYFHLWRAIRRAIREWGRPDVIHTQDAYSYYVIRVAQSLRIPFVISQHWSCFLERALDRGAIQRFTWAFSRAARVLPANKFAATDYEAYGLQPSVRWLPNALDTEIFYPSAASTREPWLLHASGLTPEKRFPDIVQAFVQAQKVRPDAVLQVVGDGKKRAEMEMLAARYLPPESVRFHGYLSKPELAALMRRASGFLLPSDVETFGCVLMEAMACGCPVLTTRVGGIPAVVREGEGILVEARNVPSIADGMLKLLNATHGLDLSRISRETRERFNHRAVGRILHDEHLRAASFS